MSNGLLYFKSIIKHNPSLFSNPIDVFHFYFINQMWDLSIVLDQIAKGETSKGKSRRRCKENNWLSDIWNMKYYCHFLRTWKHIIQLSCFVCTTKRKFFPWGVCGRGIWYICYFLLQILTTLMLKKEYCILDYLTICLITTEHMQGWPIIFYFLGREWTRKHVFLYCRVYGSNGAMKWKINEIWG